MYVSPRDYSDAARLHCAPVTSNRVHKRDIRRILRLHVIVTCYMLLLLLRLHLLHILHIMTNSIDIILWKHSTIIDVDNTYIPHTMNHKTYCILSCADNWDQGSEFRQIFDKKYGK